QHVKPRNCARFKTILLVLQLTLQQLYRLLLHLDQFPIDHDLVELRFYGRKELVQNIAECEIGAVPLKEGAANGWPTGAVKNQLCSKNADAVGNIAGCKIATTRFRRCRRRHAQCLDILDLRWS